MRDPDAADIVKTGILATGVPYRLTTDRLILGRPANDDQVAIYPRDITAIRRGGTEVIVTRREADPITFMLASIPLARELEIALLQLVNPEPPTADGTRRGRAPRPASAPRKRAGSLWRRLRAASGA